MGKAYLRGAEDTQGNSGQQFTSQILEQKLVKLAIGIVRLRNHRSATATATADLVSGKTLFVDKCTTTTARVQILELWFTSCFWDSKQSNY